MDEVNEIAKNQETTSIVRGQEDDLDGSFSDTRTMLSYQSAEKGMSSGEWGATLTISEPLSF